MLLRKNAHGDCCTCFTLLGFPRTYLRLSYRVWRQGKGCGRSVIGVETKAWSISRSGSGALRGPLCTTPPKLPWPLLILYKSEAVAPNVTATFLLSLRFYWVFAYLPGEQQKTFTSLRCRMWPNVAECGLVFSLNVAIPAHV